MFSKSQRFKESVPLTAGVDFYDGSGGEGAHGAAVFDKAQRFRLGEGSDVDSSFADDSLCQPNTQRSLIKTPGSAVRRPSVKSDKKKPPLPSSGQATAAAIAAGRIPELEREVKRLTAERNELTKQLASSKEDVSKLEGKVQMSMKDKSSLQAQLAGVQKDNLNLTRAQSVLQAKISTASAAEGKKTAELRTQLGSANHQLEDSQKEVVRLRADLDASTSELKECLSSEKQTREQLERRVEELELLLKQSMERESALRKDFDSLKESYSQLEEANGQLTTSLAHSQQTAEEQAVLLSAARQEAASIGREKETVQDRLKQATSEKCDLHKRLTKAEATIADKNTTCSQLEAKLKRALEEAGRTEVARKGLEGELTDCKKKMKKCKADAHKEAGQHQEALESMTRKCLSFEERLAAEVKLGRERKAVLNSQLLAMEAENKELRKESKKRLKEYQGSVKQLNTREEECNELREEMQRLRVERRQTEGRLEGSLKEVLAIAEQHKRDKATLSTELSEAQSVNTRLSEELDTASSQFTEAQERLSTLEQQIERAQPAPPSSPSSVADEHSSMMTHEMSRRLVDTQKRLSFQEAESTRLLDDKDANIAELQAEIERLTTENSRLQEQYSALEERFRPYMEQIDGLEDLNRLLQQQTSLAQREAQRAGDQYAKLLGHQNTKQKIQHVKKLKDENALLKQEITQLKTEVSRHKRTIKKLEDSPTAGRENKPLLSKN